MDAWRDRAVRGFAEYLKRRRWPRLTLGIVVLLTGFAGLGISWALLHLGLSSMGIRYPIAVLGAYLVFLGLLRIWVEIERGHLNPDDPELIAAIEQDRLQPVPSPSEKKDSWFSWLDFLSPGPVDSLEGCAGGLLLLAIIGLCITLVIFLAGAPVLLGDVALDLLLVSLLYRRLKVAEREHWLATAVRRTWIHALVAAVLLSLIGWCTEMLVPGATTIGALIRQILNL